MKPTLVENIVMILDSVFEDNTFKYVKKTEVYREIYTELKNRFNLDLLSKYIKAKNLNRTKAQGVLEYTSELRYDTLLLDLIIYLYPRNANKILKYSNNLFSNEYTRVCEKFSKE
jgi:hypothetical protein